LFVRLVGGIVDFGVCHAGESTVLGFAGAVLGLMRALQASRFVAVYAAGGFGGVVVGSG